MKNGVVVLLLVLLVTASFGFAFAEEANVDSTTEAEVVVMNNNYGAKMRVLQLQYEIGRRVMWMEQVIEYLEEKGEDVAELQGIVEELKLLADEAGNYEVKDLEGAVEKFIAIKNDARDLILEFREKARAMLTEEDRNTLRLRFSEANKAELDQLREQIREQRRMYNTEKTRAVLQAMNVEDEALVQQVENGELTAAQVKERLRVHYANADEADKNQLREQLRTAVNARTDVIKSNVQAYAQNAATNAAARMQERAARLQVASAEYARARADAIRNSVGGTNAN